MSEWQRTYGFIGVAAACVLIAYGANLASTPAPPPEYDKVGEAYYPDFTDPFDAKTLRVVTYDDETTVIKTFLVEYEDGLYRIAPYGYPADAEDRLSKVATSVIGIERGSLVSRRDSDHEKYGVIDPDSRDDTKLKGRGQRLTLEDESGEVLADFIVGNAAEGENVFYVRRADEKETFLTKVNVELSTKFEDWVNSDVLDMQTNDVREVVIKDYSVNEDEGRIERREEFDLTRDDSSSDWKLEGLDESEEIQTSELNSLLGKLNNLKIVGLRPRPEGLLPNLEIDPEVVRNQLQLDSIVIDLQRKGFMFAKDKDGNLQLLGKEGQLSLALSDGIAYDVYFGNLFTGTEFDVAFGLEETEEGGEGEQGLEPTRLKEDEEVSLSEQKSRYLFVAARLEPKFLGEEPQPPVKPEESASESSEEQPVEGNDGEEGEAAEKEAPPEESPEEKYEREFKDYQELKKTYDEKLQEAKDNVAALNERFGEWYYVISADDFEEINIAREDLVKKKEKDEDAPETPGENPTGGPSFTPPAPEKPAEREADSSTEDETPDTPVEAPKE
ncbi:DUF4340 domain-containing protein [Calycomorphotria hydatis]|uniref:DUF4340 domain-containing protein n=1 Tax=Calycomorphotria hydatis TaxID=2528027 RepID=A0A517TDX5_9PLAN|nr:DUF4340 domain-containing protein [Calycomorphotria hydatis]QDT66578.1 hypothetical protein V22_38480 [Calycomorphotria hydatis]